MYYLKLSESLGMDYELITCDDDLELLQMKADILEVNKKGIHNNIRWVITDQSDNIIQVSELLQHFIEKSKDGDDFEILGVWDDHYLRKIINEKIKVGESDVNNVPRGTNISCREFSGDKLLASTFTSPDSGFYFVKGEVYLEKNQSIIFRPGISIKKSE